MRRLWPALRLRREFLSLCLHLLPAALQRGHYDRLDNEQNVFLAGVVRSELRTLAGVKAALKEGSEDGGFHGGPIQIGGGAQCAHIGGGQIEDRIIGKQAAVEPVNVMHAKAVPAGGHGCEKLAELAGEFGGRALCLAQSFAGRDGPATGRCCRQRGKRAGA